MLDFCRKLTGKKAKAITEAVVEQTDSQQPAEAPERRPRRTNVEYQRNDKGRPGRPPRERFERNKDTS